MRLVTKVMAGLVLATALLLASGDSGVAQYNCGFLTIEQCRANLTGGSSFCVPINFTIRTGLPNAPVTNKRDERCASTRGPTILIRGAPFIRTPGIKTPAMKLRLKLRGQC